VEQSETPRSGESLCAAERDSAEQSETLQSRASLRAAMTEAGIDLPPGACSPAKLQYTSTVLRLSKADFRPPAMCFRTESCLQVHCVVIMNKNMEKRLFHSVPTEMEVDRDTLPPPFKVSEVSVNAGIQSKL
jgi:hypothetical protein